MLRVHSTESFGTHEGPGIRFVLFLQGCLFRCLYCHNPDTISLTEGSLMEVDSIVKKVVKMKSYFANSWWFTVSGGEPLLQAAELLPLFQKLKAEWIHIALDTNGFVRNADVEALLTYVDLVLLDIKHIDNTLHQKLTGKPNQPVHFFLNQLQRLQKPTWIRYVFVPQYSDQLEHIAALGQKFGAYDCIQRVEILPYHRLGEYKWKELWWKYELDGVETPSQESLNQAKNLLAESFKEVYIR